MTWVGSSSTFSFFLFPLSKEQGFARLMDDLRQRVGMKTISARPRRQAVQQILKALKKNEVVLMVADELKTSGPDVEFFGRRFPVLRSPVNLAMGSGASLLPMFMTRDQENRLTLQINPEFDFRQTGALQEDVTVNVALFSSHLEKMVRRYTDQWNWLEELLVPRRKPIRPSESGISPVLLCTYYPSRALPLPEQSLLLSE